MVAGGGSEGAVGFVWCLGFSGGCQMALGGVSQNVAVVRDFTHGAYNGTRSGSFLSASLSSMFLEES